MQTHRGRHGCRCWAGRTLPSPCVSTAFVAKDSAFPCGPQAAYRDVAAVPAWAAVGHDYASLCRPGLLAEDPVRSASMQHRAHSRAQESNERRDTFALVGVGWSSLVKGLHGCGAVRSRSAVGCKAVLAAQLRSIACCALRCVPHAGANVMVSTGNVLRVLGALLQPIPRHYPTPRWATKWRNSRQIIKTVILLQPTHYFDRCALRRDRWERQ